MPRRRRQTLRGKHGSSRYSASSEATSQGYSVKERLAFRKMHSVPLLEKLREKLLGWKEQLLPKHPMAEAVNMP
jgi:hypothetical protein